MGQLIKFPVRNTDQPAASMAGKDDGSKKHRASAQVLFFTGVRYERIISSLPSERLLSPAGRA